MLGNDRRSILFIEWNFVFFRLYFVFQINVGRNERGIDIDVVNFIVR